jgi:N-acetylmuramoyl-L-alanine amidase
MKLRLGAAMLLLAFVMVPTVAARSGAVSARSLYTRTLERERQLRDADTAATLKQFRGVVSAYEAIVRRFPASAYSDNALWQGGNLALLAFERFGDAADRRTAERLLARLTEQYPSSSLVSRVAGALDAVDGSNNAAVPPSRPIAAARSAESVVGRPAPTSGVDAASPDPQSSLRTSVPVMIRDIKRTTIADGMRVTIEMDAETPYRAERLDNPRRVFFDLKGTKPVQSLLDATLRFDDEIVREIRLGRHPQTTTRIVFDMNGVESYSVFTLYSPYRLVIDFRPPPAAAATDSSARPRTDTETRPRTNTDIKPRISAEAHAQRGTTGTRRTESTLPQGPAAAEIGAAGEVVPSIAPAPLPAPVTVTLAAEAAPEPPTKPVAPPPAKPVAPRPLVTAPIPMVPSANSDGKFSLSRQLGLGISRVVIDAGHGGHDPGAQSNGVSESELTLDVALRLTRLLEKQPGVDVVLTRDSDSFIPLEERTAIANREGADLFLSIHANASRNPKARGVETYFLNFAPNPAAEAVAARENSASGRAMHSLPDIVRAIALNNKIDESRDLADMVQRSMVRRLSARNKQVKDLGVKQAPFVVLIGAAMPSVLAEISFVTHKQEGQLLKSSAYRQQIAEALLDAVLHYQQSLKRPKASVVGLGTR